MSHCASFVILVVSFVSCSRAHPTIPPDELRTLKFECYLARHPHDNPTGSESTRTENGYSFHYYRENPHDLSDNEDRHEEAKILNPGTENEELVITGKYSYQNGFNGVYVVYEADKNGFRAHVYTRSYYRENPHNLADNEDHYEERKVLNPGTENEEVVVTGKYSYQNDFNGVYVVYKADKNGYRTQTYNRRYMCLVA